MSRRRLFRFQAELDACAGFKRRFNDFEAIPGDAKAFHKPVSHRDGALAGKGSKIGIRVEPVILESRFLFDRTFFTGQFHRHEHGR